MTESMIEKARAAESLLSESGLCGAETARVRELISRLETREITVAVIGQFKRGKSTLVNAMLGERLLPVGIVPVTSAVTRVLYGERSAAVHFENGVVRHVDAEELSRYISEQNNPDNELGVASVTLRTPSEFLRDGLIFVDTPGVGSVHRHNSDAAYAFVRESDAVIFMLSVDSPINEIEIDFLRRAGEYAAKFYFAVNKTDTVDEDELGAYLDYCRRLLCRLMSVEEVQMFPVSARVGTGLSELKEVIGTDCRTAAKEIMESSARMKLGDIIGRSISQLNLYWNALNMPMNRFDDKFAEMEKYFGNLRNEAEEAVGRLNVEADELETELEQALDRELAYRGPELSRADATGAVEIMGKIYSRQKEVLSQGRRLLVNELKIHQNEMKRQLSSVVSELFGMEYYYDLAELDLSENGEEMGWKSMEKAEQTETGRGPGPEAKLGPGTEQWISTAEGPLSGDGMEELRNAVLQDLSEEVNETVEALAETFRDETEHLCEELSGTLNRILLYREQNAYTVARRIEDLNILTRKLRRLRDEL